MRLLGASGPLTTWAGTMVGKLVNAKVPTAPLREFLRNFLREDSFSGFFFLFMWNYF
jgi:hypothetical protein